MRTGETVHEQCHAAAGLPPLGRTIMQDNAIAIGQSNQVLRNCMTERPAPEPNAKQRLDVGVRQSGQGLKYVTVVLAAKTSDHDTNCSDAPE
jgi:hypothetical protein